MGDCLESFWFELPDISDASTVPSPDDAGGGVADGDAVEVSGERTDRVVVEVSGMPGGSVPMFGFNMPRMLLYSFLWIKE